MGTMRQTIFIWSMGPNEVSIDPFPLGRHNYVKRALIRIPRSADLCGGLSWFIVCSSTAGLEHLRNYIWITKAQKSNIFCKQRPWLVIYSRNSPQLP